MCRPKGGTRCIRFPLVEGEGEWRGEDVGEGGPGGRRLHLSSDWVVCN